MTVLVTWSATDDTEYDASAYQVDDDGTAEIYRGQERIATVRDWRAIEVVPDPDED